MSLTILLAVLCLAANAVHGVPRPQDATQVSVVPEVTKVGPTAGTAKRTFGFKLDDWPEHVITIHKKITSDPKAFKAVVKMIIEKIKTILNKDLRGTMFEELGHNSKDIINKAKKKYIQTKKDIHNLKQRLRELSFFGKMLNPYQPWFDYAQIVTTFLDDTLNPPGKEMKLKKQPPKPRRQQGKRRPRRPQKGYTVHRQHNRMH